MAHIRTRHVGLAVLAISAVLAAILWPAQTSPLPQPTAAPEETFKFRWEPGKRYLYALSLDQTSRVKLLNSSDDAAITAAVALEGQLALSAVTSNRLLLSFPVVKDVRLEVMGKDAAPVRAELLGHEAVVEFSGRGSVESVKFLPGAPDLFKRMVHLVLAETQVQVAAGERGWTVQEKDAHGQATVQYVVKDASREELRLTKTVRDYVDLPALAATGAGATQDVQGSVEIVLARAGHVTSLQGGESIRVTSPQGVRLLSGDGWVSMVLQDMQGFDAVLAGTRAAAATDAHALLELPPADANAAMVLLQRVDGMTDEAFLTSLKGAGLSGTVPDHNRWLWRATGLLKLHPELCNTLPSLFSDPGFSEEGRALVLDLLVGAGHAHAQEVLRSILDTPLARQDHQASLFFQRLGLVQNPTPQTVDFLLDRYAHTEGAPHRPALYALGAAAGHLSKQGKRQDALAATRPIVEDLKNARSPTETWMLVEALGNAGLAEQGPLVRAQASSPEPRVRLAVATALRGLDDPDSQSQLLAFLADEDPAVQLRALVSLQNKHLSDEALASIGNQVREGRLHESNFHQLVSLLQTGLQRPAVVDIFNTILGMQLQDPMVKPRIRHLLGA